MAEVADRVIVELQAKLDRYDARIAGAERHFDRSMRNIQGAAGRTEARVSSAFRGMAAAAGVTIGVAGIVASARAFLNYADSAKQLEAQLGLATRESGSFAQAQEDVRRIAAETRSGLEETATLYATFQRNSRELGISQEQAARATETVTKAFQISGASAAEAAGGLRQFLQGIQSGTLRGEELNSVLENAPRLARLLADSLGVSIGQLRAMGQEGELAGDKLIRALTDRRFTDGIDEEFKELPITFDQAMTQVSNAAILTFGAFDRGGEFSTALANFITDGTGGFADLEQAAEETGIEIRSVMEGLADVFVPMVQGALSAFGVIGQEALSLRNSIASLLGAFDAARNLQLRRTIPEFIARGPLPFLAPRDSAASLWIRSMTGVRQSDTKDQFLAATAEAEARLRNRPERPDGGGEVGAARTAGTAADKKNRGRRGESAETRERRQQREDERFDQELRALNEDLIRARQSMVVAAEAMAALEIQEIETARDRINAGYQADADQAKDRKDLAQARADQLIALNNQVAEERIRAVQLREERRLFDEREEALRRQLEIDQADLETAAELERIQGQLAETREQQKDSALRQLDLSMEMERAQLEAVIEAAERLKGLRAINQANDEEVAAAEASAEAARRRLAAQPGIKAAERELINRQFESPRERYLEDLNSAQELNDDMNRVAIDGLEALNDGLVDAIMNAKSLGDMFKAVANQIIADLLRIAIQQAIIKPLAGALFGIPGLAAGGSIIPGLATGGSMLIGGRGGTDRNLLSLNGQPVARVSRGERIDVVPQGKAIMPVSGRATPIGRAPSTPPQTIYVDARGAVMNDRFASEILDRAKSYAADAGVESYRQAMKDAPGAMESARRYGR